MPFVIAICHQKGGVGKTTTTLALGACFAERGTRTLVVDLDPQANLTYNLGLEPDKAPYSVADVMTGEIAPAQAIKPSTLPGLDILISSASVLDVSRRLFQVADYEYLLRRALQDPDLEQYAVVLIDCPPSVGPLTIMALTAADLLIVPTLCEFYAIQALTELFKLVSVVRERTNPPLDYRLLITMFDGRGKFHAQMLEQLREYFQGGMLQTSIGFDTKLREAQAVGLPITVHAPQCRSAIQYRQLAEELSPYVAKKPQVQPD